MNIQGAYKFKTIAANDFFISLYIKVEFFIDGEQITHDQYAQNLSTGKASSFWELRGSLRQVGNIPRDRYQFRGSYSIDLSPEVKVTLIAVDGKSNIVYQREFPNYHQYSIHQPSRLSIWDFIKTPNSIGGNPSKGLLDFPNYPGLQYALADFSAYLDLDANGNWVVYGIINPNSFLNLYTNIYNENAFPSTTTQTYYDYNDFGYYRSTGSSFGGLYYPVLSFKNHEPLIEVGEVSYTKDSQVFGNTLVGHTINYVGSGLWGNSWYYTYGNSEGDGNINYPYPVKRGGVITNPPDSPNSMFPGYNYGGVGGTFPNPPTTPAVSPIFPSTFAHVYPNSQFTNPVGFPYFPFYFAPGEQRYTLNSDYYVDINITHPITYDIYPTAINPNQVGGNYEKYTFSVPLYDPIIKDSKSGKLISQLSQHPASSPDSLTPLNSYFVKVGEEIIPFDISTLPEENYDGVHQMTDTDIGRNLSRALPGWFYHRKPSFFMYDENIYTSSIYYDTNKNEFDIIFEKNNSIIYEKKYYGLVYQVTGIPEILEIPSIINSYLNGKQLTKEDNKKNNKIYQLFIDAIIENYPDGSFIIPYEENDSSFTTVKFSNHIFSGVNCYSVTSKTFWKYCNSVFNPEILDRKS